MDDGQLTQKIASPGVRTRTPVLIPDPSKTRTLANGPRKSQKPGAKLELM